MDRIKFLRTAAYEATADDEAYAALARGLAKSFDAVSAWACDYAADQTMTIGTSFQLDENIAPYEEHYFKSDLWRERSVLVPMNVATSCERLVSQAELEASEMYNDFIKPSGKEIFHCLGLVLPTPDGLNVTGLGLHRVRSQPAFSDEDERVLQAAEPYLSQMSAARWRVVKLGEKLAAAERELASGLDSMFLVDARLRVTWRNVQAAALVVEAPVSLAPSGFLRCGRPENAQALAHAIARATTSFPAGCSMHMTGRDGVAPWRIAVDPAKGHRDRRLAMVRVRDVSAFIARQVRAASNAFSLTAAETRLAGALLAGSTLASYADLRGIGMPTVRAQLAAILAKSGAGRQAEFVALAASLPA